MSVNKKIIETEAVAPIPSGPSSDAFNIITYTGNSSSTRAITGVGFEPDLVYIKERTSTSPPILFDSSRGAIKFLQTDRTAAQVTDSTSLKSFDSDGFTVGGGGEINQSGVDYVAWCWRVNGGTTSSNTDGDITSTVQVFEDAGISITTYQNNGSASSRVGHGLSTTPKIVLIKKYSVTANWQFLTTQIDGSFDNLNLNTTGAKSDSSLSPPTSTTFAAESGGTGEDMICYAFAERSDFSKYGTYSGGSTGSGNEITIGFQPDWILIRRTDVGDDWTIIDSVRGDGATSRRLFANSSEVEKSAVSIWFPTSTGFYFSGTGDSYNASGGTYIYMAFKILS